MKHFRLSPAASAVAVAYGMARPSSWQAVLPLTEREIRIVIDGVNRSRLGNIRGPGALALSEWDQFQVVELSP